MYYYSIFLQDNKLINIYSDNRQKYRYDKYNKEQLYQDCMMNTNKKPFPFKINYYLLTILFDIFEIDKGKDEQHSNTLSVEWRFSYDHRIKTLS